ncbi:hypothetical protein BJF79_18205 [Actinomadura sp. CNU-125]|uniref:hypothetical protein n=1 Tax=Actinomadura sp. CNU-125 TaxID=1904961 RepID=UPI000961AEAC|nr:hypothetical protein [Actinomadura sp. CNU-125]OLT17034.1 hypothetical protein BJF79_18205 [Actinomadura sp. CNU-125]
MDLTPFLMAETPVPDPQGFLCGVVGGMLVWRCPDGRWLAVAIGQADAEFEVMLLAAVGEGPVEA